MNSQPLLALLCTLLTAPTLLAAEQKLARKDVPKAVLEAATAHAPKAKLQGFALEKSGEKEIYEVTLREGKRVRELMIAPDGKLVSEERVLAGKDLPEAVKKALATGAHAAAKVVVAEELIDHAQGGARSYEVQIAEGGKRRELVFNAEGALLKDEPMGD